MITPSKLVNEILSLARVDGEFLLLAKRLQMLHELNRDAFHKMVKKAKLGSRKAYYLVEMAKQLRGISLPRKRLEAIGWTKAHIIAKRINASNALSLLERAEKKISAHDLAIWIKSRKPSGGSRCVLLYFNQKQYQTFEKVMEKHSAPRGSRGWGGKEEVLAELMRADLKNSQY